MDDLTRSRFLRRAAGATLAAGAGAALAASPAAAVPAERDLAWVRFGITAEYVSAAWYRRARGVGGFTRRERRALERGSAAQNAHLAAFRTALQNAGQAPIEALDLEVVFDDRELAGRDAAVTLGRRILGIALHAYLGALTTTGDEATRRLMAQVAASEAEQLAWLTGLAGARSIADPFPPVHGLETASADLARYLP